MSEKLLTDLRNGKIGETLAGNVQLYLTPALSTKHKTSQKLEKYGSLSMKLLRGCIQILSDRAIDHSNIGYLVQIATDAYHCVQKTESQLLLPPLALEKLIYHIACQLLKAQFFADALTFVGHLKQELQSVEPGARDNEHESICKQVHTQLWKAGLALQEASKQPTARHGLILNTRRLALSMLLLTKHDRKWIVDRFLRVGGEFEQKAKNDPERYVSLCGYFATVLDDLLTHSDLKLKESSEEEDLNSLFCPVVELTVQYTKCSIFGKEQGEAASTCEVLLDLLKNVKTNCGMAVSLSYLRATLSLLRVILHHSLPAEKQRIPNAKPKKNRKVISTSKCELINIFEKDLQGVRKLLEKGEHRILPMNTLAEGLDLFRKTLEKSSSGQQEPVTAQSTPQVLSTLRVNVDLLTILKQYYLGCEEGDKALSGKSVSQLFQKCLGRVLSTLNLMSSIHLQALREVTNEVDTDLVSECVWAAQRTDEIISCVSEGGGGSLSTDEHRWLGNVSYNLGLVLYQKQVYDTAEELILLSNRHLILWCTLGEHLPMDRIQKVNLWNKLELQLDCQRRLNKPNSALESVATVLLYDLKEPHSGVQRSKWLEFWWKIKRDLAKEDEYEELRSSTILDIVKKIEPSLSDDFLAPLANLLEEELKIYELQKNDTLHEEYAVVCDLLDLYQCDDYLPERALILIKLSHLLRTGRLESEDTPAECVETAISLIQEHLQEVQKDQHQLQDILAQAHFWLYICSFEKLTSQQSNEDDETASVVSPQISTSWDHLTPLLSALDLWEPMPTDLRFSPGVLKRPRGSIFCLRKMAEIFGLQQLPLLQIRALSTALLLSESLEDDHISVTTDLCSLARVMCSLGMLEDASEILRKAKKVMDTAPSQDREPLVQCTLGITEFWISMYQEQTQNLDKILHELVKSTNPMIHNYDRYCIEAETKLMLATYTAVTAGIVPGSTIEREINLELSPMQPAQEAMRLFTGVSKGVMGREFDGNVDQQTSVSPWSVLQRVLESFHLVGELYTLQGCVREAKYYFQEGLSICQLYGLPRWISTYNLCLCESYILQGSEENSVSTLKAAESVMREAQPAEQISKPKGNPSRSKRLSSADDSMDDSFVLHTRKMSLSDLCDDAQSLLADLTIPSPSFLSHEAGCECGPCTDLELHRCWLHLYALSAKIVGVGHERFECLLSQGCSLWDWVKEKWQGTTMSALENVSVVSVLSQTLGKRSSPAGGRCLLGKLSLNYCKITNLRVLSQLTAMEYSTATKIIRDGLDILELSQMQVGRAWMGAEFLYLEALIHIYQLDEGDMKSSLSKFVTTSWSVLRSKDFVVTKDVTEQMDQLSLEDAEGHVEVKGLKDPSTPARWVDSTSSAYSRPELTRKQTGRRVTKANKDKTGSLGLFSDILDEDGKDQKVPPKMKQETTTAKKKRAVQLKVKKGSLFVESGDRRPSGVFVETSPSSDVFAFEEDSMEKKPKRGRERRRKGTGTPSVLTQNATSARPRRGKAAGKKQDLTESEDVMGVEEIEPVEKSVRTARGKPSEAKATKSTKPKDTTTSKEEESKPRKHTRRRGRPAATEKVRENLPEDLDRSYCISDESFCDLADDRSPSGTLSPEGIARFHMEELAVPLKRDEELDDFVWSNGSQLLACEEIEIPRAFSEEEENPPLKRRGRRGPGRNGTAAKKRASRQNCEPDVPDASIGVDAAMKCLEEALLLTRATAPCPTYRKICQLLALCLGEKQPLRAADYLSEASSVTLRHQKLISLVKKLRRQRHSEDSKSTDDDKASSKRPKNQTVSPQRQRLLSCSRLFSFRSETDTVQEVSELLPAGWSVCQLSVVDVGPSSLGYLTDTSVVVLTRLERGEDPLLVHLPLTDSGLSGKSAEDLMAEFDEIFRESKETVKNKDKLVWWASRQSLNDQLKELMDSLEQVFFGCWKGLLLGQVKDESLQGEISGTAKAYAKVCASLSAREISSQMCVGLINAATQLSRQDLIQALTSLLGLPVGSDHLSQAVSAFQDMTKDISSKLKSAPRCPTVLILDKQLQHIPWESTATLRGVPVFRMPSLHFLRSSLLSRSDPDTVLGGGVNTGSTSFVLNPSRDLTNTQKIFQDWFEKEKKWQGVTGRVPSKDEYTTALTNQDLFIYCGHGNGREYFSGDEIERLTCRAATLLIGCSSGKLVVNGCLDAKGMALSYIVAECPCIIANLWDVTDRDIDRFLENLLKAWLKSDQDRTLLDFVAEARDSCKLPYLIGSAPVMYGLPVHLAQ